MHEKIVDSNLAIELDGKKIFPFMEKIITVSDRKIMDKWCNFFKDKEIPYITTSSKTHETPDGRMNVTVMFKLWKELKEENGFETLDSGEERKIQWEETIFNLKDLEEG